MQLFTSCSKNTQLGIPGDKFAAYMEHLRQFVEVVKPGLISYDHYRFSFSHGRGSRRNPASDGNGAAPGGTMPT